jgi:hypothetical protein
MIISPDVYHIPRPSTEAGRERLARLMAGQRDMADMVRVCVDTLMAEEEATQAMVAVALLGGVATILAHNRLSQVEIGAIAGVAGGVFADAARQLPTDIRAELDNSAVERMGGP